MRLFVACHIPPETKERLTRVQQVIGCGHVMKWVGVTNMHLTLKFLGEVDSSRVPAISRALSGLTRRPGPIIVRVKCIG